MNNKLEYRVCPECNNIYVKKSVAKITLNFLDVSMECENGHKWTEHFSLTYDGYTNKDNQRLNRFDQPYNNNIVEEES